MKERKVAVAAGVQGSFTESPQRNAGREVRGNYGTSELTQFFLPNPGQRFSPQKFSTAK
jgi:hypothetical protein